MGTGANPPVGCRTAGCGQKDYAVHVRPAGRRHSTPESWVSEWEQRRCMTRRVLDRSKVLRKHRALMAVDGFAKALAHGENKHCSGEMSNVGLWRLAPAPFPRWRKPAARLSRPDALFHGQRKKLSAATLLKPRAPPVWFRCANFDFRKHQMPTRVVKAMGVF